MISAIQLKFVMRWLWWVVSTEWTFWLFEKEFHRIKKCTPRTSVAHPTFRQSEICWQRHVWGSQTCALASTARIRTHTACVALQCFAFCFRHLAGEPYRMGNNNEASNTRSHTRQSWRIPGKNYEITHSMEMQRRKLETMHICAMSRMYGAECFSCANHKVVTFIWHGARHHHRMIHEWLAWIQFFSKFIFRSLPFAGGTNDFRFWSRRKYERPSVAWHLRWFLVKSIDDVKHPVHVYFVHTRWAERCHSRNETFSVHFDFFCCRRWLFNCECTEQFLCFQLSLYLALLFSYPYGLGASRRVRLVSTQLRHSYRHPFDWAHQQSDGARQSRWKWANFLATHTIFDLALSNQFVAAISAHHKIIPITIEQWVGPLKPSNTYLIRRNSLQLIVANRERQSRFE